MRRQTTSGRSRLGNAVGLSAVAFLVVAVSLGQSAAATAVCPLQASEVSSAVGKTVQRVSLGDAAGDRLAQCAFAPVGKLSGRVLPSPQVFLTVTPGDAADLRDLYGYYAKSWSKLATKPQLEARVDLGQGAFTLSSATAPVVTAYFLAGKSGIASMTVDLAEAAAGKRESETADKLFALVRSRLK